MTAAQPTQPYGTLLAMSAFDPLTPGPRPIPAPSIATPDQPWQVHTDRRPVKRLHGAIVGMHSIVLILVLAVVTVIALVLSASVTGLALAPLVIVLVGQVFQIGNHS